MTKSIWSDSISLSKFKKLEDDIKTNLSMFLCDIAVGKDNKYISVFSPLRGILKRQHFVNGFEAVVNLLTQVQTAVLIYRVPLHAIKRNIHGIALVTIHVLKKRET